MRILAHNQDPLKIRWTNASSERSVETSHKLIFEEPEHMRLIGPTPRPQNKLENSLRKQLATSLTRQTIARTECVNHSTSSEFDSSPKQGYLDSACRHADEGLNQVEISPLRRMQIGSVSELGEVLSHRRALKRELKDL